MAGDGDPGTVVLVHGWPGLPSDYDDVARLLDTPRVIIPHLRGFGDGYDGHLPTHEATVSAYAGRLLNHLNQQGARRGVIIVGYDIGSRIAQAALRLDPGRFAGTVLTPGYPGIGNRSSAPALASVFWYQHFHREPIAAQLLDGKQDAIRSYLTYIWQLWSHPESHFSPPHLERLVAAYSRPGAFTASVQWYHANRGYDDDPTPIRTPTIMLWPTHDPLFPLEWADTIDQHFTQCLLWPVAGRGHFLPVEDPQTVVTAIRALLPAGTRRP